MQSVRGAHGGYRLSRSPEQISITDVIDALEGPFGMTECSVVAGLCSQEAGCPIRGQWQSLNQLIRHTLDRVTLADMSRPRYRPDAASAVDVAAHAAAPAWHSNDRSGQMTITLTEAAARQIRSQLARRGKGLGLRVGVKNVGCSGFAYTYELADELRDGDQLFEGHGATLVVDPNSLAYIDGARFDFITEGLQADLQIRESERRQHLWLWRKLQPEGGNRIRNARMSALLQNLVNQPYKHGFVTDIESDVAAKGLNEDTIRLISAKKNEPEWLLEFRLKAFRNWLTMAEPQWANVKYPKIDFQAISYYSAPKSKPKLNSMDEVDPELLRTFEKLGVPMHERAALAGVAVDVIFDSVSVATTYKAETRRGRHHLRLDLGSRAEPS